MYGTNINISAAIPGIGYYAKWNRCYLLCVECFLLLCFVVFLRLFGAHLGEEEHVLYGVRVGHNH